MMHRPLLKAGTLTKVLPSYLIALVPTLAMIAGLILAIETIVHFTTGHGDDPQHQGLRRQLQCREPGHLGDGGDPADRRLSGGAQDLDAGRPRLG